MPEPTFSPKEETGYPPAAEGVAQFAIVELMGHVRLAGRISEVAMFGTKLGRIDIFDANSDSYVTQYFSSASIWRITPCSEEIARRVGQKAAAPVQPWELRDVAPALQDRSPDDEDYADVSGEAHEDRYPF